MFVLSPRSLRSFAEHPGAMLTTSDDVDDLSRDESWDFSHQFFKQISRFYGMLSTNKNWESKDKLPDFTRFYGIEILYQINYLLKIGASNTTTALI